MATHTDTMRGPPVSLWGVRSCFVPPLTALRAFADGFVGSLAGGLVYCLILAYYDSHDLQIAGLRVLALSLTFGVFEVWRVRRMRSQQDLTRAVLFTLSCSLLMFWALGAARAEAESFPDMKNLSAPVEVDLNPLV